MLKAPLPSVFRRNESRIAWVGFDALASHTPMLYILLGSSPAKERDRFVGLTPSLVRQMTAWLALFTAATAAVREPLVKEDCMIALSPMPSPRMTDIKRNVWTLGVNVRLAKRPSRSVTELSGGSIIWKMAAPAAPEARNAVRRLPT